MNQINPEIVINDLLEQNKQQSLQISLLRATLIQAQATIEQLQKMLDEASAAKESKTSK